MRAATAETAVRARDWDGAIAEAPAAVELSCFNLRAHTLLGRALWRSGDAESGEQALRIALAQAPGYGPALRALAGMLSRAPDRREGAREIRLRTRAMRHARIWSRGRDRIEYLDTKKDSVDEHGQGRVVDRANAVVVVSGLPRSGTSMMMQMLAAGGVSLVCDGARTADESNQRGYFEDARVTRLARDPSWMHEAQGKAIKIIAPLVPALPRSLPVLMIFMERPIKDVLRSQRTMLDRLGRTGSDADDAALSAALRPRARRAKAWAATGAHAELLLVRYDEVIEDPGGAAARVNRFLGGVCDDESRMARAVEPTLRHVTTA